MSDEVILKLLTPGNPKEDYVIGVELLFKKYPQLYDKLYTSYANSYVSGEEISKHIKSYDPCRGGWSSPDHIRKALGFEET